MKPTDMHDKYNMTRVKNKKINTTLRNFGKITCMSALYEMKR